MKLQLVAFLFAVVQALVVHSTPEGENIASKKRVRGGLINAHYVTDESEGRDATAVSDLNPLWFVDLEAIYKLTSIQLYTRGNLHDGYNVPFTVYAWDGFTSPCNLFLHYPWKTIKAGLMMNRTRATLELATDVEARYIIVMTDRDDHFEPAMTVAMGELRAYGVKVRDDFKPDYSADIDNFTNVYLDLRRKLSKGQGLFWVEQNLGEYEPNYDMQDVAIGWHHNRVNTMAVTRGKGRILLLSGKTGMKKLVSDPAYEAVRSNAKAWLAEGQTDPKFEPVSDTPTKGVILLITRDDKFNVEKIHQLITSGENSAIFGYVHQGAQEDSACSLLKKLSIIHLKTDLRYGGRNINLGALMEKRDYISPWLMLEQALKSWKVITKWDYVPKLSWVDIEKPKFQELLKQVLKKYQNYSEYICPCDMDRKSLDEADRAALYNLNRLYMYQTQKPILVLPGANQHPGYISPELKPTTYKVTLKSPIANNRFLPVGAWAKAGGDSSYKVIKKSTTTLSAFSIRVNVQTDNLGKRSPLRRWQILSSSIAMKEEGDIHTAIGGPIVVSVPHDEEITIEFQNVYRYPWFDIRDPKSVENWDSELKKYRGIPFSMVMGDTMNTLMPRASALKINGSHMHWIVNYHDNMIKVMHNYRGTDFRKYQFEVFSVDVQITIGWAHSGHPFMGHIQLINCFDHIENIKRCKCNVIPHELGHNLQVNAMTLRDGTQVTNEMYIPVVYKYLLNVSAFEFGIGFGISNKDMQGMVDHWKSGEYRRIRVSYYSYISHYFTPALVGRAVTNALHTKVPLKTEEAKVNFWIQQLCRESQYDLLPLNKLYHFPINKETEKVCKPFPCFIPDDKYTQQVPELVERVIKESGKECSRSNPKPVKFKHPILHGVDEREEPIVHIH